MFEIKLLELLERSGNAKFEGNNRSSFLRKNKLKSETLI